MLMLYLAVLWIILTVALSYRRKSPMVFLCWFLVTIVALWPVTKWVAPIARDVINSAPVQSVSQEFQAELDAELRKEFPEFYK